jgi:hypothetical protein
MTIPAESLASGNSPQTSCTAFEGTRRIASGALLEVVLKVKEVVDRGERAPVLIFDDASGELIEIDFRGTAEDVAARLATNPGAIVPVGSPVLAEPETRRKPGRPRLGVVAREVTLLPRHWEWLNRQPGGASVALRKLVEEARRVNEMGDRGRRAQEAAYRFMSAMAGNEPGFEEALRSLFAADQSSFYTLVDSWPIDIREHARKLAAGAFPLAS